MLHVLALDVVDLFFYLLITRKAEIGLQTYTLTYFIAFAVFTLFFCYFEHEFFIASELNYKKKLFEFCHKVSDSIPRMYSVQKNKFIAIYLFAIFFDLFDKKLLKFISRDKRCPYSDLISRSFDPLRGLQEVPEN